MSQFILKTRYLYKDETTFDQVADRVAKYISDDSEQYNNFKSIMQSKKFVPGGRTLAYSGTDKLLMPNCVVLPVEDSLDSIFDTLKRAAILQQNGAGLGFDFSKLRPAGFECNRTGGKASGPISFMALYSHAFKIVQQYNRSGANIGILSIYHPDILSFVTMKNDITVMNNFNISVLMTKEFIDKVNNFPNEIYKSKWDNKEVLPRVITYDKDLLVTDIKEKELTYEQMFNIIVESAWKTGEPGMIFEDNVNESNPLCKYMGKIHACNPCGEIMLYDNECCNLGSINLEEFCDENPEYSLTNSTESLMKFIHIDDLKKTTKIAVQFMNNVVDKLSIPDFALSEMVLMMRRLGLGIMGLADLFIKIKIPYNSIYARKVTENILGIIKEAAYSESSRLVSKYGSVASRLLASNYEIQNKEELMKDSLLNSIANCALTCIAPTGSTSNIHQVSSGIEPFFAMAYRRTFGSILSKDIFINKHLEKYLKDNDFYTDEILNEIVTNGLKSIKCIPDYVKDIYITAQEMTPRQHILMQAAAQKYIDNSISKTCNFPKEASMNDIRIVFMSAFNMGCKGTTVYRDQCRVNQVFVSTNSINDSKTDDTDYYKEINNCKNGTCDM